MATPTHVFVTAAEGREVPMPQNEVSAPGGVLLRCLPGKRYRVPWTTYTRRRINSGDLLLIDTDGRLAHNDIDRADASTAVPALDTDGSIAQPEPEPVTATATATEHTTQAGTEHTAAGHAFDTADLDLPANPPSKG